MTALDMTRGARRAVVVLFALMVAVGVVNLLFTVHYVHATQAAAARQAAAEQSAQRREGAAVEQKLCTTLGALAALKPPPGPALANPSRAFEQELSRTLNQLAPDLGCADSRAESPSSPTAHSGARNDRQS